MRLMQPGDQISLLKPQMDTDYTDFFINSNLNTGILTPRRKAMSFITLSEKER
jgi:hypothetical protein